MDQPMDQPELEAQLAHPDFQFRLKAVSALKTYPDDVAIGLLRSCLDDPEFLVRSFVAMGLGKHRTPDAFAMLLELMKLDTTPSVRAEAANSLSLFGLVCAPHLVTSFSQDDHWLVRRSILAALVDLGCSAEVLEVCLVGIGAEDEPVQQASIDALGSLGMGPQQERALEKLLELARSDYWRTRTRVAYALKHFPNPAAQAALDQLRQDPDHRVVGAALENLLPGTELTN
jgi:HEAT repeat protein